MRNILIFKIISVFFLIGMYSCDFLDVVPNDTPTLDHAFSNRSVSEKFLRTCYSHLPDITDPYYYPGWNTSSHELEAIDSRGNNSFARQIARGNQNASNPYLNYWSGTRGGKNYYTAIRDCNIFLNNIHTPKDIEDQERRSWIGEVKFLKAYYHFFLMMLYGPIVIADDELPLSASPEELMVYREPVDVCVDYIVNLLDEAIEDLPEVLLDPSSEYGRIDQLIAKSVKAKVLTWGASPLFNGNTDYRNWIDNRGKHLIPQEYDKSKWERTATATKEAIDAAHAVGKHLYTFNKYSGGAYSFNMNDTLVQMMTIRYAISEEAERNTGVVWASQDLPARSKGGSADLGFDRLGHLFILLWPWMYVEDANIYPNYGGASWHMYSLYYSNNGVPIEEDNDYDYTGRFNVRRVTPGDRHESYLPTGQTTVELHFNREPRFYAGLCFDRGYVELASTMEDGGKSCNKYMEWRNGEVRASGYPTVKKFMHFNSSSSRGNINNAFSSQNYHFPLLRLADLYLLYAEALNEMKDEPDHQVYEYIDMVRENAGLKGVVDSWKDHSKSSEKPATKAGMREIIQRERMIELSFEAQSWWDIRRWKLADIYFNRPKITWNSAEKEVETYYKPRIITEYPYYTYKDYLFPIPNYDLRVNHNLIQTYGWD